MSPAAVTGQAHGMAVHFSNATENAPFPSAAAYLGPNVSRFRAAFADVGDVWVRVERQA